MATAIALADATVFTNAFDFMTDVPEINEALEVRDTLNQAKEEMLSSLNSFGRIGLRGYQAFHEPAISCSLGPPETPPPPKLIEAECKTLIVELAPPTFDGFEVVTAMEVFITELGRLKRQEKLAYTGANFIAGNVMILAVQAWKLGSKSAA